MCKKCDIAYEIVKGMVSVYNDWNNFNELQAEAWHCEMKLNSVKDLLDIVQGYYLSSISVKKEVDSIMSDWRYMSRTALQNYNEECKKLINNALSNPSLSNSDDDIELRSQLRSFKNNPSKRNFRYLYRLAWENIAIMEKKKKEYDERLKIVVEQKQLWEKLHNQIKQWYEGNKE